MRAQPATEFLLTYGWALAIITIAILALYASGIINPNAYYNPTLLFSGSFTGISYYMNLSGVLVANIQQTYNAPINITSIACAQNGAKPVYGHALNFPRSQIFVPVGSNVTLVVRCAFNPSFGKPTIPFVFSGSLTLNYTNDVTGLPGVSPATLVVRASGGAPVSYTIYTTSTSTSSSTSTSTSSFSSTSTSTRSTTSTSTTSTSSTSTSSTSTSTTSTSTTSTSSTSTTSTTTSSSTTVCVHVCGDGSCCDPNFCCACNGDSDGYGCRADSGLCAC